MSAISMIRNSFNIKFISQRGKCPLRKITITLLHFVKTFPSGELLIFFRETKLMCHPQLKMLR